MTEEIKEILDNQKLINVENDYERIIFEYLANNCSEFDDEHIKQLVNLKVEQYKQSLDYITNLQQENERLKQSLFKSANNTNKAMEQTEIYKSKCEKVINAIDILQEIIYQQPTDNKADDMWLLDRLDGFKNILNGSDEK